MSFSVKRAMLNALLAPGVTETLSRITNTRATIFMLHRFRVPDLGISGHDPEALRRNLAYLRKCRYELLPLDVLLHRLREGQPLKRAVAFTIDDGYFDHAEIAAPVFAEFDCPVTYFLPTGFIDGKVWLWWDRLMHIFQETRKRELTARVGTKEVRYYWDSPATRSRVWWDLNMKCQDAREAHRLSCINDLSREAEVDLPSSPPARFAPMSWHTARKLESCGVSFGAHTVTHPVLGTTSAEQAEWEITESWKRLNAELAKPVPLFCYPNGRSQDIGEREISTLRTLHLQGGLMAHPGELSRTTVEYRVPRFPYSDHLKELLQGLSGLEHLKARFRHHE